MGWINFKIKQNDQRKQMKNPLFDSFSHQSTLATVARPWRVGGVKLKSAYEKGRSRFGGVSQGEALMIR